jgi:hypothetical protein
MSSTQEPGGNVAGLLAEILESVKQLRAENSDLASAIDQINGRINILASVKEIKTRETELGTTRTRL